MRNKFLLGGIIAVLLIAIPVTIFLLSQRQQTQTKATAATVLSLALTNSNQQVSVGQEFSVDVNINPGSNPGNQVSYVKATINFDSNKLATAGAGFTSGSAFPAVLEGPVYTSGVITFGVSIGSDYTKAVQSPTKIGTILFRALATTNGSAQLASFDTTSDKTIVYSIASATDRFSENVLSSTTPLALAIGGPAPTPTSPPGPTTVQQLPVCTNLKTDRTTSGNAPFSITFTADGTDSDGTITSVSFDFGDGPNQDATVGGGIGSNSVSVAMSHTYNNPGTYTATATMIDNNQNRSAPSSACSKTVTVNQAPVPTQVSSGGGTSPAPTAKPTIIVATPTLVASIPTPVPTTIVVRPTTPPPSGGGSSVPPAGPGETILAIGGVGLVLSVIGALLFFGL